MKWKLNFNMLKNKIKFCRKIMLYLENYSSKGGDNHYRPIAPLSWPNPHTYNVNGSNCPSNGLYRSVQCPPAISVHDCPINEFSPSNMLPSSPNSNVTVKSEDFNEFFSHFEIVVTLHGWDFKTKSLFLASNLAGSARALLTELNETQRMDYESLVDKLNRRFGYVERAELFRAQLKTRV